MRQLDKKKLNLQVLIPKQTSEIYFSHQYQISKNIGDQTKKNGVTKFSLIIILQLFPINRGKKQNHTV